MTFAANPDLRVPDPAVLDQARKLAPAIAADGEACEQLGTMPPAIVDALRESGLFDIMVPRELGGSEVSAVTALAVFEELTAADSSIGWSQMANASTSAFSAYLGEDAAQAMFGARPAVMAGQFSPKGPSVAVDGGYQVQGRYSFGSGSGHADWVGGGTVEMDGQTPRMVGGRPVIRAFFVPRSEVEFLGNWDVMGLIGTGSYDYAISERVVPAGFTFEIMNAVKQRGGSLYELGVLGMTSIGHSGFALGVSRRAIEELLPLAGRKQRLAYPTPVAGIERFQYELGRVTAALKAARRVAVRRLRGGPGTAGERGKAGRRATAGHPPGHHAHRPRKRRGRRSCVPLVGHRRHPAGHHPAALPRHPRQHPAPVRR